MSFNISSDKIRSLIQAIFRLALIVILLLVVASQQGKIVGYSLLGNKDVQRFPVLELQDINAILPAVTEVLTADSLLFELNNSSGERIAYTKWFEGEFGYGGKVPLFVLFNKNNKVAGVILDENYESPDFLTDIEKKGLLKQWNGYSAEEIASVDVDGLSGATLTSEAIIRGVQQSADGNSKLVLDSNKILIKKIVGYLWVLVLLFAFFFPKRAGKYYVYLQVGSILIFGIYLKQFISFNQIIVWLTNGFHWQTHGFLILVFALAIVLPLFTKRSFYCAWVCPFGAAQTVCGKVRKNKFKFQPATLKYLRHLREVLFMSLLVLLWLGFSFDLTLIEPFTLFVIKHANYWVIGYAILFLIVSVFISDPWCRFFCPTGYVLEWLRKKEKTKGA